MVNLGGISGLGKLSSAARNKILSKLLRIPTDPQNVLFPPNRSDDFQRHNQRLFGKVVGFRVLILNGLRPFDPAFLI